MAAKLAQQFQFEKVLHPISSAIALQVRWKSNPLNSVSLLQQYYRKMPIRKKWRRAIVRGTMVMCEKTGQVKIPPLAISGYDEKKNPYRGRFEDLRSTRVCWTVPYCATSSASSCEIKPTPRRGPQGGPSPARHF
eukprot:s990_g18.t1